MRLFRFLKDGKWLPLYLGQIRNRLRKDLNLSDVLDVAKARENLELTGEVESHYHDKRYLPLIDKAKQEVLRKCDDINIDLSQTKEQLTTLSQKITKTNNNKMDNDRITVGETFTGNPKQGDIWFDTKADAHLVKVFYGGKWVSFSGVWEA